MSDITRNIIAAALLIFVIGSSFVWGAMPVSTVPGPKSESVANVATSTEPVTAHVLVYHSVRPLYKNMPKDVRQYTVSPEALDRQLSYMRNNKYNIISFDDLVLAARGKLALPPKSVVLTFDDGWKNQYEHAFPLLKKYKATATFFIFTNAPEHQNYMTWNQVAELSAAGMTIGSHSRSHPYLGLMFDSDKIASEFDDSKAILERKTGKKVTLFAFPFGQHTAMLEEYAKAAGYEAARVFGGGTYHQGDDLFTIKGIPITEKSNMEKILAN